MKYIINGISFLVITQLLSLITGASEGEVVEKENIDIQQLEPVKMMDSTHCQIFYLKPEVRNENVLYLNETEFLDTFPRYNKAILPFAAVDSEVGVHNIELMGLFFANGCPRFSHGPRWLSTKEMEKYPNNCVGCLDLKDGEKNYRGTATVFKHPRVLLTCAHCIPRDSKMSSLIFFNKMHLDMQKADLKAQAQLIRKSFIFMGPGGYAALIKKNEGFKQSNRDIACCVAFEDLANGHFVEGYGPKETKKLLLSDRNKFYVGYPNFSSLLFSSPDHSKISPIKVMSNQSFEQSSKRGKNVFFMSNSLENLFDPNVQFMLSSGGASGSSLFVEDKQGVSKVAGVVIANWDILTEKVFDSSFDEEGNIFYLEESEEESQSSEGEELPSFQDLFTYIYALGDNFYDHLWPVVCEYLEKAEELDKKKEAMSLHLSEFIRLSFSLDTLANKLHIKSGEED